MVAICEQFAPYTDGKLNYDAKFYELISQIYANVYRRAEGLGHRSIATLAF